MRPNPILQKRDYSKFFTVDNPLPSPSTTSDFLSENFIQKHDRVSDYISFPSDFKPRDFAYNETPFSLVLLGFCAGKSVMFGYVDKKQETVTLLPQVNTLMFPDKNNYEEELYVIKSGMRFTGDNKSLKVEPIFVTAGKSGLVYIFSFNVEDLKFVQVDSFIAHFNYINDLCFAPCHTRPELRNLLASCSKDGGVFVYDIFYKVAVLKIYPKSVPVDDVLAIDWKEDGEEIVSASLDGIRVWKLDKEITKALMTRV
jgi:WD40 repeat protein